MLRTLDARTLAALLAAALGASAPATAVEPPRSPSRATCWSGLGDLQQPKDLARALGQAARAADASLAGHLTGRLTAAIGGDTARALEVASWAEVAPAEAASAYLQAVKHSDASSDRRVAERLLAVAENHPGAVHRSLFLDALDTQPRLDASFLGRLAAVARGEAVRPANRWMAVRVLGRVMENDHRRGGPYHAYLRVLLDAAEKDPSDAVRYLALEMAIYPAVRWDDATLERLGGFLLHDPSASRRKLAAHVLSTSADGARVLDLYRRSFAQESDECFRNALVHFAFRAKGASALPWLEQAARADGRFASDHAAYRRAFASGHVDFDRLFPEIESLHGECAGAEEGENLPPLAGGDDVSVRTAPRPADPLAGGPEPLAAVACEASVLARELRAASRVDQEPYRRYLTTAFAEGAPAFALDTLLLSFSSETDPAVLEGLTGSLASHFNEGDEWSQGTVLTALAKKLRDRTAPAAARAAVVGGLQAMWEPSVEVLHGAGLSYEELIADGSPELSAAVGETLRAEAQRDVGARPGMLARMVAVADRAPNPEAASRILSALPLDSADAPTVERVLNLLASARDAAVRRSAASALGTVGPAEAGRVMAALEERYAAEPDRSVREAMLEAVVRAGFEHARPALARLKDPSLSREISAWRSALAQDRHTWQLLRNAKEEALR